MNFLHVTVSVATPPARLGRPRAGVPRRSPARGRNASYKGGVLCPPGQLPREHGQGALVLNAWTSNSWGTSPLVPGPASPTGSGESVSPGALPVSRKLTWRSRRDFLRFRPLLPGSLPAAGGWIPDLLRRLPLRQQPPTDGRVPQGRYLGMICCFPSTRKNVAPRGSVPLSGSKNTSA